MISIPAPARGRTKLLRIRPIVGPFQFPPPRGGERHHLNHLSPSVYFNSRPREGANLLHVSMQVRLSLISIPAPARGRTVHTFLKHNIKFISIPAPARGRTKPIGRSRATNYFNSRPREGANSKTVQNRAIYLVSLLKFGRISAILPYILSATHTKKT